MMPTYPMTTTLTIEKVHGPDPHKILIVNRSVVQEKHGITADPPQNR